MKVLFEGIYNLFSTGAPTLYTNLSGKMYLTEAPQNTDFPYAIFHLVANNYDFQFNEDFEDFLIQFTIFDDNFSASNISTYYENLKSLYDWSSPTVTGYTVVYFLREFAELLRIDNVWQYVVQYAVRLEKN